MSAGASRWTIVGQGLAGTCLAWAFWQRGEPFLLLDRDTGGSSRIAAGMINPITGKNFEPSWRIADFLPAALDFYSAVESQIGREIWHSFPVLRLARSIKEWEKIRGKLGDPLVAPWIAGEIPAPPGWAGAVEVRGGGRLDTLAFIDGSREFFQAQGCYQVQDVPVSQSGGRMIWCDGAAGLLGGRFGPHRCAKGEILTLSAPGWDETRMRIGAGGWLVPVGGGNFKVGSTYEWNDLNETPTPNGRARVEEIARSLGGEDFEIIAHDAGIRPILRRSQPLVGPLADGGWMFNALGSKGALYAPKVAEFLVHWLLDGVEPDAELNFQTFLTKSG